MAVTLTGERWRVRTGVIHLNFGAQRGTCTNDDPLLAAHAALPTVMKIPLPR
jgi:hypothetical protein